MSLSFSEMASIFLWMKVMSNTVPLHKKNAILILMILKNTVFSTNSAYLSDNLKKLNKTKVF